MISQCVVIVTFVLGFKDIVVCTRDCVFAFWLVFFELYVYMYMAVFY